MHQWISCTVNPPLRSILASYYWITVQLCCSSYTYCAALVFLYTRVCVALLTTGSCRAALHRAAATEKCRRSHWKWTVLQVRRLSLFSFLFIKNNQLLRAPSSRCHITERVLRFGSQWREHVNAADVWEGGWEGGRLRVGWTESDWQMEYMRQQGAKTTRTSCTQGCRCHRGGTKCDRASRFSMQHKTCQL